LIINSRPDLIQSTGKSG